MQIPFVGPAYRSRSLVISGQRSVNLYLQTDEGKGGKSPVALIGTPGLKPWVELPGFGGIRGVYSLARGVLLAVRGSDVYRISAGGQAILVGQIASSVGPVSIEENGSSAVLVDGLGRYAVNQTTWAVTTVAGGPADRVAFLDGFFIFNRPNSQQFDVSDLFSTTVNPLSFAAAEGSPDRLVTLIADHRELWLFGEVSTEVWAGNANIDFPFERVPGAFLQVGCAARHSVARLDNSVFWLGGDERGSGMVWRADGYRPTRISTHAIEREFQSYGTLTDAVAYAYQQEGHTFYVLSFPSADRTWVYDAAVGEWHERAFFDEFAIQHRHRGSCAAEFNNRVVVGDHENGWLYTYDLDTYTEGGQPIRRIRSTQHLSTSDYVDQAFYGLQVDMESGVGLQSGQGEEPQAMLRWSNDGGRTFGNELWSTFGRVGEYRSRAKWRRLGRGRDRVFELTITDPVRVVILGAALNAQPGLT